MLDLMDGHLAVWESEKSVNATEAQWAGWIDQVGALLGCNPDGDQQTDGYSMDWLYDMWKAGHTPRAAVNMVGGHRK